MNEKLYTLTEDQKNELDRVLRWAMFNTSNGDEARSATLDFLATLPTVRSPVVPSILASLTKGKWIVTVTDSKNGSVEKFVPLDITFDQLKERFDEWHEAKAQQFVQAKEEFEVDDNGDEIEIDYEECEANGLYGILDLLTLTHQSQAPVVPSVAVLAGLVKSYDGTDTGSWDEWYEGIGKTIHAHLLTQGYREQSEGKSQVRKDADLKMEIREQISKQFGVASGVQVEQVFSIIKPILDITPEPPVKDSLTTQDRERVREAVDAWDADEHIALSARQKDKLIAALSEEKS